VTVGHPRWKTTLTTAPGYKSTKNKQKATFLKPVMDTLATILDGLEDAELSYVLARSKVTSDKAGYEAAGVSKSAFYSWTTERREDLNNRAQALKKNRAIAAELIFIDALEKAAQLMVNQLDSDKEHIAQSAAKDILDRAMGSAVRKVDVTSGGEKLPPIRFIEVEVEPDDDPD